MKHITDETLWDLVVCGSGPAGIGAAVAAAKLGKKVLLLEAQGQPGGTIAAVPFMPVNRLRTAGKVRSAVHEDFARHLEKYNGIGAYPGPENRIDGDGIRPHPEYAELAIYDLLEDNGVTLKLFSPVMDAEAEDGHLACVIVREKRGLVHYKALRYIDATGDGDLAAAIGCNFMFGKDDEPTDESTPFRVVPMKDLPKDGEPVHMPITLGFSLCGMDLDRFFEWLSGNYGTFNSILKEADEKGYYTAAWYGFNRGTNPGQMGVNNGAYLHQKLTTNGLDSTALTEVRRMGVRVAADLPRILRDFKIPGGENAALERTGGILGVRDTRRIEGEYVLTFADSQHSREFPDTIARKYGAIDANQLFIGTMQSGFAYPFRSLIPKGFDNLLIAGRCGSASFLGHSAGKSMGNMMALGIAAGVGAALSADAGCAPIALDTALLRKTLQEKMLCDI